MTEPLEQTTKKEEQTSPEMNITTVSSPQVTFWHAQTAWGSDQDILLHLLPFEIRKGSETLTSECVSFVPVLSPELD